MATAILLSVLITYAIFLYVIPLNQVQSYGILMQIRSKSIESKEVIWCRISVRNKALEKLNHLYNRFLHYNKYNVDLKYLSFHTKV